MRGPATALLTLALVGSPAVAAASSHTVTIIEPEDGATVSGIVDIVAETTGSVQTVAFDRADSEAGPWIPVGVDTDGSDGWSASWDTTGHDGPAVLRATARDGVTEATDTVGVIVSNPAHVSLNVSPDAFSPNGDGRKDVATFEASSDQEGEMEVQVLSPSGAVKRSWGRLIEAGETVVIEWNGKADGDVLPDATYKVRARSGGGQDLEPLVLDTKRPTFKWRTISPEPLSSEDLVRFKFTSHDRSDTLRIDLLVRDRVRVIGTGEKDVAPGKRSIAWKPRYRGGGPLYPGLYTATIKVHDDAGNVRKPKPRSWRVDRKVASRVFTRLKGTGARVALTFDDCHFPGAWRRILNVLEARDVEATFFCPGTMMQANAGLVKRAVKEGHTVASHAWDHALLTGHSVGYTAWRLKADARVAWQIARTTTWPYFRPPYGAYDGNVKAAARATSHPRIVLWDVDPLDWTAPGVSVIVNRVVNKTRSGSIILLHTLDQTASALPKILNRLKNKGLTPVDLPNLFAAAGYRPG
jgi:peptidoglycan/xylan/chitin deacetylase (PgdA/CDA1 family)